MSMLSRVRDVLSIVETGSLVSDDELEAKLAAKAPLVHGHTIAQVSGLQAALDDKISQETHLTDYNTLVSNDARLNSNLQSLILAEQDSWNRAGQDISALQAKTQALETTKADAIGGVLTGSVLADALLGELQDSPEQTRNNNANSFGYYGTLAAFGCSGASVYPTRLTLWRRQNANPASGATPLYLRILRIVNGAWAVAYQSENAVRMNDYTLQDVPMGPWQMKNVDGLGAIPASETVAIVAVDSLTATATASVQFGTRTVSIAGCITSALTAETAITPAAYAPAIQVRFVVAGSEVASRADVADATARAQAQDQIILTRLESKAEANHTHTLAGVTGLPEALAAKQDTLTAGENIAIEEGTIRAVLPVASESTLGAVRVGNGLAIANQALTLNAQLASFDTWGNLSLLTIGTSKGVGTPTRRLVLKSKYDGANNYAYLELFTGDEGEAEISGGRKKTTDDTDITYRNIDFNSGKMLGFRSIELGSVTIDEAAWNGKQDVLVFDDSPTAGSTNPVTSAGIKAYVDTVLGDIDTVLASI